MENNYREYNTEDFAQDSSFIRWVQKNQSADRDFWENWVKQNPDKTSQVEQAKKLLSALRFESQTMDESGIDALWAKIEAGLEDAPKHSKLIPLKRLAPLAVAASLALLLFFRFLFAGGSTDINSLAGETITYSLPDGSQVTLNALSTIHFSEKKWATDRTLTLEGEAFFQVSKGSAFDVVTANGTVSVLGTSFNVFSRETTLKVTCFEGKVRVTAANETDQAILAPGDGAKLSGLSLERFAVELAEGPSWRRGMFEFDAEPLSVVFEELERQFDLEIIASPEILGSTYTGFFEKGDLEIALQAICWPKQLTYSKKGSTIRIEKTTTNN